MLIKGQGVSEKSCKQQVEALRILVKKSLFRWKREGKDRLLGKRRQPMLEKTLLWCSNVYNKNISLKSCNSLSSYPWVLISLLICYLSNLIRVWPCNKNSSAWLCIIIPQLEILWLQVTHVWKLRAETSVRWTISRILFCFPHSSV